MISREQNLNVIECLSEDALNASCADEFRVILEALYAAEIMEALLTERVDLLPEVASV